jgi:hypothetical protein
LFVSIWFGSGRSRKRNRFFSQHVCMCKSMSGFSFLDPESFMILNLTKSDTVCIKRECNDWAHLFFINDEGDPVPPPPEFSLKRQGQTVDQYSVENEPLVGNKFVLIWAHNYQLRMGDEILATLGDSRQLQVRLALRLHFLNPSPRRKDCCDTEPVSSNSPPYNGEF